MDNKLKLIVDSFGLEKVMLDEPLKEHTANKLGGPAGLFFVATTPREIQKMVETVRQLKLPLLVFGTGSKIAISDQGFKGVVIKNRANNLAVVGVKGKVSKVGIGVDEALVEAEGGVAMSTLVEFLKNQKLNSGLINNLPGTVGGNLFLNRGLQSMAQKIKVLDENSEIEEINAADLSLRKHIILSAVFKFKAIE